MSSVETAARLLRGHARATREIVTPEGVTLTVELAEHGERAIAFVIDLFFWFCGSLLVVLTAVLLAARGWVNFVLALSIMLFVSFLIRNFYFIHFELAWRGMTPGKRIVGIRVIDRHGGPLLPSAIVARNFAREIEMFIPLGILLTQSGAGAIPWERLILAAWLLSFVALVFVNRDRMRAGDLIAGTIVIALPRQHLLGDLVERQASFVFTDRQLRAYGAFELQVLEDLLRRPDVPGAPAILGEVCVKICRKIEWSEPVAEADRLRFLRDFYTAQRAFLEREQLFGRRRADKYDSGGTPA